MPSYTGRFAPSPTGPLHFGSLVAALGSYLDARAHNGRWLVRMEDLDVAREQPGAADEIVATLARCGLEWDGDVEYQSRRLSDYRAALDRLESSAAAYPCSCTRREMADSLLALDGARIYPGTCRGGLASGRLARAVRVRTNAEPVEFDDRRHGRQVQCVERDVGDFVLLRADGYFSYQLAVVVDDAAQGVTDVVRGIDLIDSTARQIFLQRLLGLHTPRYMHLPVAVAQSGEKLSKHTGALPAGPRDLPRALAFLGHVPPTDLAGAPASELLRWGIAHWNPAQVPATRVIQVFAPAG